MLGPGGRAAVQDAEFEELGAQAARPTVPEPPPEPPPAGPSGPEPQGPSPIEPPEHAAAASAPPTGGSRIASILRGAGAIPRAIGAAGDLAEAGMTSLLGTGRLSRTAGLAARGGVEAGLFNVGNQISEDSLGDTTSNGEKLAAAFAKGAVFGAGTAGIAGVLSSTASDGVGALIRPLHGKGLDNAAGEQAWRALDPLKKFSLKAERQAGGISAVGKVLISEGVIPSEEALARSAIKAEDLLPRVTAAKQRIGEQIGEILKGSTATVGARELFEPIHRIVRREEGKAGFEGVVRALDDYRRSLAAKLGFTDASGKAGHSTGASAYPFRSSSRSGARSTSSSTRNQKRSIQTCASDSSAKCAARCTSSSSGSSTRPRPKDRQAPPSSGH